MTLYSESNSQNQLPAFALLSRLVPPITQKHFAKEYGVVQNNGGII